MIEGTDYGTIPGTNKPTLFKPGAEKLTTFFGLTVEFDSMETVEDWIGDQHGGEPFFYYWFRCRLSRADRLIAEADGSCNGWESRYRWRWVSADDIPAGHNRDQLKNRRGSLSEFVFAVNKAETAGQYGKPAEYWQQFKDAIASGTAKKGKRSTKKGDEYETWEIDTTVYRVPNEDVFSQVNTLQKMAQKRALVAATLIAVNASEFFTQDLEDLDVDAEYHVASNTDNEDTTASKAAQNARPETGQQSAKPTNDISRPLTAERIQKGMRTKAGWQNGKRLDGEPVTDNQTGAVAGLLEDALASMPKGSKTSARHDILEYLYDVRTTDKLTKREASGIIAWLKADGDEWVINEWAIAEAARVLEAFALDKGQQELPT